MLNKRSADDKELLIALNRTPLSWIVTRHSLQVNLFITLGRIFDTDNDAFSVDDLLKCCIEDIEIFSLENLRERKVEGQNGVEPEWLQEYIENAYEPNIEDFNRLRGEFSKRRRIFEDVYKPIRHKIIAHNDKAYMDNIDELWSKTNIDELEKIIWFLNDLKVTLFETYSNGYKPILKNIEPNLEFYENDFSKLLEIIKG